MSADALSCGSITASSSRCPNTLLMFRLGDFYELFYDDAVTAARELEITLTARNKEKGQPIPMCGVPYHSAENYIARLIQKGYRVAICDQMEDAQRGHEAGEARSHAHRHARHHDERAGAAVARKQLSGRGHGRSAAMARRAGLAHVDISTGEFRATEIDARRGPRGARNAERSRGAGCPQARPISTFPASKPMSKPGSSGPTTPRAACATTSICWRSTAAVSNPIRWRPAPPRRSCTICATRSARRSITWSGRLSTIAPTR